MDESTTFSADDNALITRGLVEIRGRQIDTIARSLAAYDKLHAIGLLRQRDSFYKWLLSLLHPVAGRRFLDVSCGQGPLLHFAALARLDAYGVDIALEAIRQAHNTSGDDLRSHVGDAELLPYPDDTFDYVMNIGSIEHYLHPWQAILEMSRVLKPDGLACILLPNTFGLLGNILHVWRTGDVFDDGQPLQRYGTRRQWQRLLDENGLTTVRVAKFERAWPRTRADALWYALRPHKLFRVLITPFIPLNLASFLVFLCRKAN